MVLFQYLVVLGMTIGFSVDVFVLNIFISMKRDVIQSNLS